MTSCTLEYFDNYYHLFFDVLNLPDSFYSITFSLQGISFFLCFLFNSKFLYFIWHIFYSLFLAFIVFQTNYASDLLRVERNMVLRRRRLLSVLKDNEIAPTVTSFPMLGVGDFIDSPLTFSSTDSASIYLPDYIINPHPRLFNFSTYFFLCWVELSWFKLSWVFCFFLFLCLSISSPVFSSMLVFCILCWESCFRF